MWQQYVAPDIKLEVVSSKENAKTDGDTYLNGGGLTSIKED
jgi:hypothetical protein